MTPLLKTEMLFLDRKVLFLCMRIYGGAIVAPSFCNAKLQCVQGFECSKTSVCSRPEYTKQVSVGQAIMLVIKNARQWYAPSNTLL